MKDVKTEVANEVAKDKEIGLRITSLQKAWELARDCNCGAAVPTNVVLKDARKVFDFLKNGTVPEN